MAGVKPLLETIGALLPKGIKAWHASPHDFDKVDLSKIGTGQGAQSYGPGFYAAESPTVSGVGGEYWKEFADKFKKDNPQGKAVDYLQHNEFDRAKAADMIDNELAWHEYNSKNALNPQAAAKNTKLYNDLVQARDLLRTPEAQVGPRVYELNLKADPRSFLQWDEPLAKQNKAVQGLVEKYDLGRDTGRHSIVHDESTGQDIYNRLTVGVPGNLLSSREPVAAMNAMRDAGIPGVRYLDAKSRSLADYSGAQQKDLDEVIAQITKYRAEGNNLRAAELDQHRARMERTLAQSRTYNYVVNNPDIIEIMRKLAIPGVATGGAASVYQPQGQQ